MNVIESNQKILSDQLIFYPSDELKFYGPYENCVICSLIILNPSEKSVAFKIKTNKQKLYKVKPNNGIIDPKQSILINFNLVVFSKNQVNETDHKFKIQYRYLSESDKTMSLNEIIDKWEIFPQENVYDFRINCKFVMERSNEDENEVFSLIERF
ncbi:unnamed protein product [Brachionus calyciflorus]|uniref:MSP domain-containing protein n=1 Tax=Brachionus calyciflorus TaxID=104777 RepID=A0A813PFN1_9BILA|nr:unnamed protein product [Brachionus calyciflorus]